MGMTKIPTGDALRPAANWCKQSVLFALMVRAKDLNKGIDDKHAPATMEYAEEVWKKISAEVGPPERYPNATLWLTEIADRTFRWVASHLDR